MCRLLQIHSNEIVGGARRDLAEIAQALIDTPDEVKREVMLESMYGLVSDYGDAAAVESLGWYLSSRAESVGLDDGFQPALPDQMPEDVVNASTRWALGELMRGEDLDKALKSLNGVLDRLVKKLGRESIVHAADSDPKKPRWACSARANLRMVFDVSFSRVGVSGCPVGGCCSTVAC